MKITQKFVKWFLMILLVIIIINVLSLIFGFYQIWMAYVLLILLAGLFFLIFRKNKAGAIKFLAWLIPILLILGVLYINFLPFGYSKDYAIKIDENGDVLSNSHNVYLQDMNGTKIKKLTNFYDYGPINLIIKSKVVLKNVSVNISIEGNEFYLPYSKEDLNKSNWDYVWDFSKGIPKSLDGTAKYNKAKACAYFDSSKNQTLSYSDSSDMFENQSFIVYAEWMPDNQTGTNQQIIGHYNWELWQNKDSVRFMIGRLVDKNGSMPSINYKINETTFFNKKHNLVGVYIANENTSKGYIELWVDDKFVGKKTIGNQTIWQDYNSNRDLSFGKSGHGLAEYYSGCVYKAGFNFIDYFDIQKESFISSDKIINLPISGTGQLKEIKVNMNLENEK